MTNASAPAHQVVITNPLDANLDLNTIQLLSITLVGVQLPIRSTFNPAIGSNELTTVVDLRPTQNLFIDVGRQAQPHNKVIDVDLHFYRSDYRPAPKRCIDWLPAARCTRQRNILRETKDGIGHRGADPGSGVGSFRRARS
jgi:hypothetical protein